MEVCKFLVYDIEIYVGFDMLNTNLQYNSLFYIYLYNWCALKLAENLFL